MKKTYFVLFLLLSLGQFQAFADEPACILSPNDPYDHGARMQHGKYKGECIDTTKKRAVQILSDDGHSMVIANFRHDQKWWIATIPENGVEEAIFQIDRFKTSIPFVVAAHTQLRLKMRKDSPILLKPQDSSDVPVIQEMRDIVFSVEYIAPKDVPYDIISGEFDRLGIVARLVSMKDRGADQLADGDETIQQLRLNISGADASKLLRDGINRSQALGIEQMYNTLKKNCTTELFDLFDRDLTYSNNVASFKTCIFQALDPIAGPSITALKDRKLIDDSSELPTLNQEFAP